MPEALSHDALSDLEKALDFGIATQDQTAKTQGSALTSEALDGKIKLLTVGIDAFPLLEEMGSEVVGNRDFHWINKDSNGSRPNGTVSNDQGTVTESQASYSRGTERTKVYGTSYSYLDTVVDQPNFIAEGNQELQSANIRINEDKSRHIWKGNATISARQVNGYDEWVKKAGTAHTFDMASARFSGLDANGFTNITDVERATRIAGQLIANPEKGGRGGRVTRLYVPPTVRTALDNSRDFFTSFVDLSSTPGNERFTGVTVGGFNNGFGANGGATRVVVDHWIDDQNDLMPETAQGLAVSATHKPLAITPTLSTATVGEKTRFTADFFGVTTYYFAGLDAQGIESTLEAVTVTINGTNNKVSFAIPQSASQLEGGYRVFRVPPGLAADPLNSRKVIDIVKNPSGTTTFVDLNYDLPGGLSCYTWDETTPEAFLQVRHSTKQRYYNKELAITAAAAASRPFALFTSFAIAMPYYKRLAKFKNIFPASGGWSPTKGLLS